jgi:hypothetical protein
MLNEAAKIALDKGFGNASYILVSPKLLEDILEYMELEEWIKKLPQHKQKQERLKLKIRDRLHKYVKRNLPQ